MDKYNCPNCAQGNISFKTMYEVVKDISGKEHSINILVGICEHCKEKIYPKESTLMIERIQKPNIYTLELPGEIVDKLIISAKNQGIDFRRYALQKLAE